MISIEKVKPEEAKTLLQLSFKTFEDAFKHHNNPDDYEAYVSKAFTIEKITSELNNPNSAFYFAVTDDEPIGYLKLNTGNAQNEYRDKNYLEVERIYVLNTQQGKGIGNQLLNFAIEKAIEDKHEAIWLGVWEHNHGAQRFYQRLGFTQCGSHQFAVGSDIQTDILMLRSLVH